jgi:hypothetical protein
MKSTLQHLVQEAQARSLPFILVGGHAAILLGVPRFTRDIDFLITDVDRQKWKEFLEEMGYRLYHRVHAFDQFESKVRQEPPMSPVDLMLVDASTWEKLSAAAVMRRMEEGFSVRVPNPLHLIAMKLQASKAPFRKPNNQDFQDVIQLILANGVDLTDPEVGAIIQKYGSNEVLDQIRKNME